MSSHLDREKHPRKVSPIVEPDGGCGIVSLPWLPLTKPRPAKQPPFTKAHQARRGIVAKARPHYRALMKIVPVLIAFLPVLPVPVLAPAAPAPRSLAVKQFGPVGEATVTLRARLADIMLAADAQSGSGDYSGAVSKLAQAQAFMAINRNRLTTFKDMITFADVATARGDAMKAGHVGDPCPQYAWARTESLKATAAADAAELREAVRDTLRLIERKAAGAGCSAPSAERPDAALAGHYYLSGVMETGSELLLATDGTFEWFLSYGSADEAAHGNWHRDGDTVMLVAAVPATDTALFAYVKTEPWTAGAEKEVRRRAHDEQERAMRAACPFLTDDWTSTPPAAMIGGPQPKPPAGVLRDVAASARAKAVDLRTQVESLASRVMQLERPRVSSERADDIQKLMSDWLEAKGKAQDAAREAGLPDPALGDPRLPASCTMPPVEEVTGDASSTWLGGIGARVNDLGGEQGAPDVRVTLHFADGRSNDIVTAGRGLALLPGKPDQAIVGATLHAIYAPGRDARFSFQPMMRGILDFSIDAKQLEQPPFTVLRFKIDDDALIPDGGGTGRYKRRP